MTARSRFVAILLGVFGSAAVSVGATSAVAPPAAHAGADAEVAGVDQVSLRQADRAKERAVDRAESGPLVEGGMHPRLAWWLRMAFGGARERVDSSNCQVLFAELGADPLQLLSDAVYSPPRSRAERETCNRRSAAAFTRVGPARTVVCDAFAKVPLREAAAILLHEALHNAGQTEWPSDPEAPTSQQIQRRVEIGCSL